MNDIEQTGFAEFDGWRALARRTRELLDAAILEGGLPAGGAAFLADTTLPHIEGIQTGFVGWLRSDAAGVAELRYLWARRRDPGRAGDDGRRAAGAAAEQSQEAMLAARDGAGPRSAAPSRGTSRRSATPAGARAAPGDPRRRRPLPAGRRTYADIPRPRGRGARRPARGARAIPLADRGRPRPRSCGFRVPPRLRVLRRRRPAGQPRAAGSGLTVRPTATSLQHAAAFSRWRSRRRPLVSSPGRPDTQTRGAHPTGRVAVARTAEPGSGRSEAGRAA